MDTAAGLDAVRPRSEMAALIDAKDWAATPLGPRETWSAALSFVVKMILSSGFPMAIRWGPQFVMIYNDGYRSILGDKHPWALGLPFEVAWPEVQSNLRGLHEAILCGESSGYFGQDFPLRIQRFGSEWEDVHFTISYGPVPDDTAPAGVGGVLVTVVETTSRVQAEEALREREAALRESEHNLRLVLNSATDAIYCVDTNGLATRCNAAFLRMSGFESVTDVVGRSLHELVHHTRPDGTPYPKEECPVYRCARGAEPAHVEDERFYRRDGSSFPVEYWVAPILRDGELQGAVCSLIDITERKQTLDRQAMLLRELNHRVKNVFALTGSMVALSARSAKSIKELAQDIRSRLDALSKAHTLVLPQLGAPFSEGEAIPLQELLERILLPFARVDGEDGSGRCDLQGPPVGLGPQAVTRLALVFHELATNSCKYGALSSSGGHVDVTWQIENERLHFCWEERDGPAIEAPPATKGFGTLLATNSIRGDFGGSIAYDWNRNGLIVRIEIENARLKH